MAGRAWAGSRFFDFSSIKKAGVMSHFEVVGHHSEFSSKLQDGYLCHFTGAWTGSKIIGNPLNNRNGRKERNLFQAYYMCTACYISTGWFHVSRVASFFLTKDLWLYFLTS